jgi:hypothetical protein
VKERNQDYRKISIGLQQQLGKYGTTNVINTAGAVVVGGAGDRAEANATSRGVSPSNYSGESNNSILSNFHHVIWAGDLNYRIRGTRSMVMFNHVFAFPEELHCIPISSMHSL